jgi:hypothetical protein
MKFKMEQIRVLEDWRALLFESPDVTVPTPGFNEADLAFYAALAWRSA